MLDIQLASEQQDKKTWFVATDSDMENSAFRRRLYRSNDYCLCTGASVNGIDGKKLLCTMMSQNAGGLVVQGLHIAQTDRNL